MNLIHNMCLQITLLKSLPHPTEAKGLNNPYDILHEAAQLYDCPVVCKLEGDLLL